MFFSKSFLISAVVLSLGLQVSAHAVISPAVGVTGAPARSDAKKPSAADPCGGVATSKIAASTAAQADAAGSVKLSVTNFNGYVNLSYESEVMLINSLYHLYSGKDGSRAIKSVQIDPTGAGTSFTATGTVTTNGDAVSETHSTFLFFSIYLYNTLGTYRQHKSGHHSADASRYNVRCHQGLCNVARHRWWLR